MLKAGNIKAEPLVSIIVTNYNGEKYLSKCFSSLQSQSYPNIELILADDCSTDGSVEFVKTHFPKVKITRNSRNSGLSAASNNGAKLAGGSYLLFYNNDTIAFRDFVERMVEAAERDPCVGVCCACQLPYREEEDATVSEERKDMGGGSDIYGYICLARDAGHIFYPDAAIFIRKDLFEQIGGFDPDFFLYGEDMDICWRVHLMGYKIIPVKEAKFRHDSLCTVNEGGRFQTTYKRRYLVERQVINKLFKYYELKTLFRIVPTFVLFYFSEALFFLIFKLNSKMFFGVYIKAVLWNLCRIPAIVKNRRYIQRIRKTDDRYIMELMYPKYRKLEVALKRGVPKIS
jgi:GT2 family glycosyltransferase